MDTAVSFFWMRRECRLWQCIGSIDSIIWLANTMIFTGCKCNITPHICRHTYCSNMAKAGMNSKTLQYLMGHSDIGVTLNTYTYLGLEDAEDELKHLEYLKKARNELDKTEGKWNVTQKMFKSI